MRIKALRAYALTLALAILLSALSGLLVACGGGGGGQEQTPTVGTTGVGTLVSEEGLVSNKKLKAMYTFEGENGKGTAKAIDPYSGASLSSNDGKYLSEDGKGNATVVKNPDADTLDQSGSALSVRLSGLSLGKLTSEQVASASEGFSVSFWAYNSGLDPTASSESDGTLAFDFMNVVGDGNTTITWGNVRGGKGDLYPDSATVVGRGAYTEEAYTEARQSKSDEQLAKFDKSYTSHNAISGNVNDVSQGSYAYKLAEGYQSTWRYVTIVVDETDGILFYTNGRLAYQYTTNRFSAANFGATYKNAFAVFMAAAMAGGEGSLGMFVDTIYPEDVEVYVDDVIVGTALEATEAQALYENLSGNTVDGSLQSAMSSEEQEEANALSAYIESVVETFPVEGDSYGVDASGAGVAGKDLNNDGVIDDAVGAAKKAFVDAYKADPESAKNYLDVIGSVDCNTGVSLGQGGYYTPTVAEDGTFKMTVSGIQLTPGNNNYEATYVTMYSGSNQKTASVRVDWSASNFGDYTWDTSRLNVVGDGGGISGDIWWKDSGEASDGLYLNVVQRYCVLDIVFEYDGEDLTITYNLYYHFVGETVQLTTESGKTIEVTIPKSNETLFNTVTYTMNAVYGLDIDEVFDMKGLSIRFGSEKSAYLVESVEGGERKDGAPATDSYTVIDAPQGNATISNSFATLQDAYASVQLPAFDSSEEDLDIMYTADVYTAGKETWHGPAFILVGTDGEEMTVADIDKTSDTVVYIRSDNYDMSKNTANTNLNINYNRSPLSGAYGYTLGNALYKKTEGAGYIYDVTPLKFICTVKQHGDLYLITYYHDSVDDANMIRRIALTFRNKNDNLFLVIGGEATYMENIVVTINGEAATPNRTTSGSMTKMESAPSGYEAIA